MNIPLKDSNFLKENNARHQFHPMAHPADSLANPPKIITGGEGVRIKDIDGRETIDAVGGLWNVNLGYSCAPVKEAITRQLDALPYYSTFRGTSNDTAITLSYELAEFFAEDGMVRTFFTSGGSDSIETALRLARQFHKLRGEHGRTKFLSLKKGYHGTHIGGASINGNANFRTAYEPLLPGCYHIPAPYTYRNPFNETDPAKLAQLCASALEDEIAGGDVNLPAAEIRGVNAVFQLGEHFAGVALSAQHKCIGHARHDGMGETFAPTIACGLNAHKPRILAILHIANEDSVFNQCCALGGRAFIINRKAAALSGD